MSDEIMPNVSQFPPIARSSEVVCLPETPFILETVRRTVLKLNPLASQPPSLPPVSETALAAMQRLVAIINTLRSSQPAFLEGASLEESSARSFGALETLLPYVSEEAYDVMDALRSQRSAVSGQWSASESRESGVGSREPGAITFPDPLIHSSTHPLTTIDTLIPSLLWQIARSDYRLMHLIEGVRGRCWQPQGWAVGMVRLVVMLELEAPTVRWCFDLATGHPAKGLLESSAIVQTDEATLPVEHTARNPNAARDAACPVGHQLQAILRLLQLETGGLGDFVQGVVVELLQPGLDWQAGTLRLRFGVEFSAQSAESDRHEEAHDYPEPLEAELIDERATIACAIATAHVSVLNAPGRSLSPATLVRASEAALLERDAQQTTRQTIVNSLYQLQHWQLSHDEGEQDESEQLAMIVQAALNTLAQKTSVAGIGLLQPTLLLDELAPQLLWSLTRCTYEIMQLLGGLPAQVLQPGKHWEQGTLRLLAVLRITADDLNYTLDLSAGRSLPVNAVPIAKGTIVQANTTALCQQPIAIEPLTAYLQQRWDDVPASKRWVDGLAVEWLEGAEQDWQTGTMTLNLSLSFFPDAV